MEFNEIIKELEKFKDTEEYNNYIGGLNTLTSDRVNEFLQTEDGKKFLQPTLDRYHSKGLESWQANNLQKLVDEEVKKRHPDTDPKDIELANLKAQFESLQKEATKKDLRNKALKVANEKKLPIDLVDFFVGDDENNTLENLTTFEKSYNAAVAKTVETRLGSNYIPEDNNGTPDDGVTKAFKNLNPDIKI